MDERADSLRGLYAQVTATSADVTRFVRDNADNLIGLTTTSRAPLEAAARHSPAFACTLRALDELRPAMDAALGAGTDRPGLRLRGSIVSDSRGAYRPEVDAPVYSAGSEPRCYPSGVVPGEGHAVAPAEKGTGALVPPPGADLGVPNSPQERQLLSTLLAGELGMAAEDVPEWSSSLVGPLYRGTEVTIP